MSESFFGPAWDPYTRSVYLLGRSTLHRIKGDNSIEQVAQGLHGPCMGDAFLCSDGAGSLYYRCAVAKDVERAGRVLRGIWIEDQLMRIQLPYAWRATSDGDDGRSGEAGAKQPAGDSERVQVTQVPIPVVREIAGMICVPCGGPAESLIVATGTALYRLPLPMGQGGTAEADSPVLLAGKEGEKGSACGQGETARFNKITGLAADADGALYVADVYGGWEKGCYVRRVAPDGTVSTIVRGLTAKERVLPMILPNGYLALRTTDYGIPPLQVLDLDLKPPPLLPPAPAGPQPRTLTADIGALLGGRHADLVIVVGSRRFPVHRLILIARCDYFLQRLEGGFADGAMSELVLPDTDPAAFELLLSYIYTGGVEIPPALAPAVAELADRLLLPELCSQAREAVLSGVSADNVADLMLWAEGLGGSFQRLLSSLKAWCLAHQEGVKRAAPGDSQPLAADCPAPAPQG